jgi:DNA repair exonuclease SbcCD ATPase subunit
MIINRLKAENVLKYARLELDPVPAAGLIAIIGDNESGKSSIGESICFALFGRTFSLNTGDLDKVIRWGESRCSIRLDFTTPDNQRYQVARFLDELGNHSASISRVGEEPLVRGVEETAAILKELIGFGYTEFIESFYLAQREITTPHPHSFAVRAMAGVDILEKVAASCREEIAADYPKVDEAEIQKAEISSQIEALSFDPALLDDLEREQVFREKALEADREDLSRMKDLRAKTTSTLEAVRDWSQGWLSLSANASLRERRANAARLDSLIADLEPGPGQDPRMVEPSGTLAAFAADLRQWLVALEGLFAQGAALRQALSSRLGLEQSPPALETGNPMLMPPFAEQVEAMDQREEIDSLRRNRLLLISLPLLFLAVLAEGLWILLTHFSDLPPARTLVTWLQDLGMALAPGPWLTLAAAVMASAGLLVLVLAARSGTKLKWLRQESQRLRDAWSAASEDHDRLDGLEALPLADAMGRLKGLRHADLVRQAEALEAGPGRPLLDTTARLEIEARCQDLTKGLVQNLAAIAGEAAGEIERLHESLREQTGAIARALGLIERERERQRRYQDLLGILATLQARIDALGHRIRVRELAIDLLGGAIHYISQRFNTEIRNLAADSLPRFTKGRYEHLQIDENLKVKAFSNEKRNFMDLDEISSGTQRQIMLAVRLALSQKLVNSVIQGPQMLFLDEPFAFFDEDRTASSLAVLPQISRDFTQIWVTSQTFPAQSRFDLTIECRAANSDSPRVWHGAREEKGKPGQSG